MNGCLGLLKAQAGKLEVESNEDYKKLQELMAQAKRRLVEYREKSSDFAAIDM